MSQVRVVIPARLGSSRLPAKVLAPIGDRPVLAHVIAQAQASKLGEVWVATDAPEVLDIARQAGVASALTRSDHASGSDRINELAQTQGWAAEDVIVNPQGDEPFMPAELLQQVADGLREDARAAWSTLACPLQDAQEWQNPACVKVVCDQRGYALYFSRAPIPHVRDATDARQPAPGALRHLGLYAYRVGALAEYCRRPSGQLEALECLEQLRALEMGLAIRVLVAPQAPPVGIDTAEDLRAAQRYWAAQHSA